MIILEWGKVGEHRFETGVDRGVLYPASGVGVPWIGLNSVQETLGRDVKSYYLDGIKYLDHYVHGSYAATLSAYTYPDELDTLVGNLEYAPGVFLHDQSTKLGHLTYRTRVGNELEGVDHGYKVHLVYNVTFAPSDRTYETIGESLELAPFEWELRGTPPLVIGARPTAHISLDSRRIAPETLARVEEILYGHVAGTNPLLTPETDVEIAPAMPPFTDLLGMIE